MGSERYSIADTSQSSVCSVCAFSLVGIITVCLQFSISITKLLGDSLPVAAANSCRCTNGKVISCLFSLPAPSLGSPRPAMTSDLI